MPITKPKHTHFIFFLKSKKSVISYEKGQGDRYEGKNWNMTMI